MSGALDDLRLNNLLNGGFSKKENPMADNAQREVVGEFEKMEQDVRSFFAKVFPKAIDAICMVDSFVSRNGQALLFKNQIVEGELLTYDNCLEVCKNNMNSFSNTLNALVGLIKTRMSANKIEENSLKLCIEYNTIYEFLTNIEKFKSEKLAHIKVEEVETIAEDFSNSFSKELVVPIGKAGKDEVSINFDIKSTNGHAVVSGMAGSGKSSLLHSLILSAAYKYSPEQLQFWILDFKDGTEFVQYQNLKHVKMMLLKSRAIDSVEIMSYISNEYARRANLIKENGGGDITEYNKSAKAQNKPLLPRLLIVIDEFVVMHRSCFKSLNEIVRLGRSLGMGFVFSSQIVEVHAEYGDAIQQANHFFEFKNADATFGRLIRNATDEEIKFVNAPKQGRCIYRNGNDRKLLQVAYSGNVEEQNEFIKNINDKWSNFAYQCPTMAGTGERKFKNLSDLKCDGQAIRDDFKKNKKIYVPIGESRVGKQYLYRIDRENPLLVIFGDETRVTSVELSVVEHFKHLAERDTSVFYIDLNSNPDRETNAITAKYDRNSSDICYVDTNSGAKRAIDKVYQIMNSRAKLISEDKTKDIGNPIELIIHNAENILGLKEVKQHRQLLGLNIAKQSVSAGLDLQEELSNIGTEVKPLPTESNDDIGVIQKISEIIKYGKNRRIYLMMYFESRQDFSSLTNDLFGTFNYDFKDMLVVPRIPDEYEQLSYSEIIDALKSCRLQSQASVFENTNLEVSKLEQSDFVCAVLVDDKVAHKIIPYEWDIEN